MIKDSEMCTDYIGMVVLVLHNIQSCRCTMYPYIFLSFHSAYEMYQSTQYCGLLTFKREMLYFLRCSFIVCKLHYLHDSNTVCYNGIYFFKDGMYIQSAVSVELPERPQKPDVPRVDVRSSFGVVGKLTCKHT